MSYLTEMILQDTTGVLLLAKDKATAARLSDMFQRNSSNSILKTVCIQTKDSYFSLIMYFSSIFCMLLINVNSIYKFESFYSFLSFYSI